ncbi:hypothetical protein KR200_004557 [Drosophila serrata]|nr:hypothetical protein KR200_004557 [Drosophila serrata]
MVLAERNTTDVVRNGRRSRGPSPNTHTTGSGGGGVTNSGSLAGSGGGAGGGGGNSANASSNDKAATAVPGAGTPESSDDDNSTKRNGKTKAKQSEYEEKIRVGRDYQAVCPPLVPEVERRPEQMNERALLVWSPTKEIPDLKLEEYISVAKEKYGYNGEQALGMLFWHKHDLERAVMDLANFTPFPDEWTIEDKVLFEQAFQFHGKSFHRIRQMLPDKSIASLVKYYYSWKKTRHRSSAMDRQEKAIKAAVKEGSENGSEVGSNEESDTDDKKGQCSNGDTVAAGNNITSAGGSISTTPTAANNNTSNIANNNNNTNTNSNASNSGENVNNHGGGGGGSSNNTSSSDLDTDQLGILYAAHAQGDEVLGFGPAVTEGATNGGNNDGSTGNSNDRVVVGGFCKTCHVVCHILFDSPLGRMCKSCHTHWRRTGNRRPISGPESNAPRRSTHNSAAAADRSKRKPPKGMYINHDDLTALASCENPSKYLSEGDRKITSLMAEIQKNRQMMEQLDKDCDTFNAEVVTTKSAVASTETAAAQPRISARWLPDEIQVALLAIREYGKNYPMIAKMVTTKTEAHVRTFFVNNRRRYNLDQIVKEYEAGKSEESGAEEQSEAAVVDGAAAVSVGAAAAASAATTTAAAASVDSSAVVANATAARKPSTEASNNGVDPSPETQTKKEEPKKPEPAVAASKSTEASVSVATASTSASVPGTASASAATPASTATVSSSAAPSSVAGATGSKASTATITITDESDTATNSSSDVVTAGATTAGATAAATASLSSASAAPAPKEDISVPKTAATSTGSVASGTATAGAGANPSANSSNSSKRDSSMMVSAFL